MTVFKIIGLLFLLTACTSFGFFKSYRLSLRSKRLNEICIALQKLQQLICSSTQDLNKLLEFSFGKNFIGFENEKPIFNTEGLLKEDMEFLYKLFKEIGISQRETEYKRIAVFETIFKNQLNDANENTKRLSKLYNSLGFLGGLSICIFLI